MAEYNVGTLAVRMMRLGANDFVDKMFMPFSNGLDNAILNSLKHRNEGTKQRLRHGTRLATLKLSQGNGKYQVRSSRVKRSSSKPIQEYQGGEKVS